uniref:Acyl-CoA thioesterase n=1 Tax=Candidatus Desulfatibia profunda TaxID=2841695 RepID=A0A8J6NUL1_9BACT|nr:acyl-CoA thioesterase [Candidatus Desulfatibia profunda]
MARNKIFTIDIEVRFRDLDAMGHVNNAVFFTYFEEGRKNFSHKIFNLKEPSEFTFIMAHISCDYLKPVKLSDRPSLQMWVKDIGNKSFDYGYKLIDRMDESIVYAAGESVQVCYDYKAETSIPVPEHMRTGLSEYLNPDIS